MKKNYNFQRIALLKVISEKTFRIMKLTTFFLWITIFNVLGSNSYSQINLNMKDVPLQTVFNAIESQSKFFFLYSSKMIDVQQMVNINTSNGKINEVLDKLLANTDIDYRIKDRQILLVNKEFEATFELEQNKITGIVTDKKGTPLAGVTVLVTGTSVGTLTDINGKYSIVVPQGSKTLTFSFIGMKPQEIIIGPLSQINVTMAELEINLDEVVVVGYGVQTRKNISSAISTISVADLTRGESTSTGAALVGKISGITFRQRVGTPGSAPKIQIRNGGDPLFVIDGVMTDASNFNNLDQNDIENISLLKDGSAAIYGVKAANGVILVTTKRGGFNEKLTVDLNARYGWEGWTMFPRLLNAYEWNYAQDMREINKGTFGMAVDYAKSELAKWKEGYYNPATGEDYRGFNWVDQYVNHHAPNQYLNLSIKGGSDKIGYYLSASSVDQEAVFKDFNFKRLNLQSSFDLKLTKNIKLGYQLKARNEVRNVPGISGSNEYTSMLSSLYSIAPIYRPYANDNVNYINAIPSRNGTNPAGFIDAVDGSQKDNLTAFQNIFTLEYNTPIKGLKASGMFSLDIRNDNIDNFEKGYQEFTYNRTTDVYSVAYDKTKAGGTYLQNTNSKYNYKLGQFLLNYNNSFASKHNVTGTVGYEFTDNGYNYLYISQHPIDNQLIPLLRTNANNTVSQTFSYSSTASFVFRAGYNYENKYFIDLAGRDDGSSRFPVNKRWGFFPSISAAWQITEENFIKNSSIPNWLTSAKLRFSYGEMGDDNVGTAFFFTEGYNYNQGSSYISDSPLSSTASTRIIGSAPKSIPNNNLSWMHISVLDAGTDLLFFNKLSVQFDAFKRVRKGIPASPNDVIFPLETGLSVLTENLNSDGVLGIDGKIQWDENGKAFKWSAGVNWTLARQRNYSRYGELFQNAWQKYWTSQSDRWANVDQFVDYAACWMFHSVGVFKSYEEIENYPVDLDGQGNTTLVPGDLIKMDYNGDGVINNYDKRPLGYAGANWPAGVVNLGTADDNQGNKQPILAVGINLSCEYKGFDVAADFAGGYFNTFAPDWSAKVGVASRAENGLWRNNLDTWHHADIFDINSEWVPGTYPALRDWSNPSASWWIDYWVREVNYMRLRNVVFGYTLPNKWTQKVSIQNLRIFFEGTNLIFVENSLKGYYDFDPEVAHVDMLDYPQHKGYTIGLSVKF
jgi:TonB-linked SusC/RagA family outer membrane protein